MYLFIEMKYYAFELCSYDVTLSILVAKFSNLRFRSNKKIRDFYACMGEACSKCPIREWSSKIDKFSLAGEKKAHSSNLVPSISVKVKLNVSKSNRYRFLFRRNSSRNLVQAQLLEKKGR